MLSRRRLQLKVGNLKAGSTCVMILTLRNVFLLSTIKIVAGSCSDPERMKPQANEIET